MVSIYIYIYIDRQTNLSSFVSRRNVRVKVGLSIAVEENRTLGHSDKNEQMADSGSGWGVRGRLKIMAGGVSKWWGLYIYISHILTSGMDPPVVLCVRNNGGTSMECARILSQGLQPPPPTPLGSHGTSMQLSVLDALRVHAIWKLHLGNTLNSYAYRIWKPTPW